jgi:hypothetical protein
MATPVAKAQQAGEFHFPHLAAPCWKIETIQRKKWTSRAFYPQMICVGATISLGTAVSIGMDALMRLRERQLI